MKKRFDRKPEEFIPVHPVMVESSKYDRDLKFLESFTPTVISQGDRNTLQALAMTYGFDGEVNRENFHKVRGELMFNIFSKLSLLSEIILDKEREYDLGKKTYIQKKGSPAKSSEETWGIPKDIVVKVPSKMVKKNGKMEKSKK